MARQASSDPTFAFVPAGTPMFADIIERLDADPGVSATRRRDMISGLRRVAKALDREPEHVPCDARWLQPRLKKIAPAASGLATKSWQNATSDARSALAHCGIIERRQNRIQYLRPTWQSLWKLILTSGDKTLQPSLCRFVHFLNLRGTEPTDVSDSDAKAFRDALAANETIKSPEVTYRAAVNGWNLAVHRIGGWPQSLIPLESRQRRMTLKLEDFSADFRRHLDEVMDRLAVPDPLDDDGRNKALRPATIKQYRIWLVRLASELVHSGVPVEQITSVNCLLAPAMAERGLRQMLSRTGNKPTRQIEYAASLLRNMGKVLQSSNEDLAKLKSLATKLKLPKRNGMTAKNRDRLRVLQDPVQTRRLLNLPESILQNPPRGKSNAFSQALAREDAVAIAILLYCPVRIKNLAEIHIERELQRPGDGRVFLVLNEGDTKTERPIEFELPPTVVKMIDRHLATRSPTRCPRGTPWLFANRDGTGPVVESQLSARLSRRIRKEIGLDMNAHLFRHFAVMLWLDANPGAYEVARRLLGHSEVSHTISMYSGLEARSAVKLFGDLISSQKGDRK